MMAMFLLSTFLVAVVFMNMLIAIMSNTFAEVLENAESNALSEQLALIDDNMFIVNFNKMFFNQKYILRIAMNSHDEEEEDPVQDAVSESTRYITKNVIDQSKKV